MTTTRTAGPIRTDIETCGICGSVARKSVEVITNDETGEWSILASGKCARLLLGYNPFNNRSAK